MSPASTDRASPFKEMETARRDEPVAAGVARSADAKALLEDMTSEYAPGTNGFKASRGGDPSCLWCGEPSLV